MLDEGKPFKAIEVDGARDFHVLGTPLQVSIHAGTSFGLSECGTT